MEFLRNIFGSNKRNEFIEDMLEKAKEDKKHIVLPESDDTRILQAAEFLTRNGIANITLVGDEKTVFEKATEEKISLNNVKVVSTEENKERYAKAYMKKRRHKGVSTDDARELLNDKTYYATMMVKTGDCDGMVAGASQPTKETFIPSLKVLKDGKDTYVSTYFIMAMDDQILFFADAALNIDPDEEGLAEIAKNTAKAVETYGKEPRIAMLSFSTKGSAHHPLVDEVKEATERVKRTTDYIVEGEIQVDTALVPDIAERKAPDSEIQGDANILVFPDLNAGNISYKLVQRLAGSDAFGPITYGLEKPINDLSRGCDTEDIVDVVAITAVQAQGRYH